MLAAFTPFVSVCALSLNVFVIVLFANVNAFAVAEAVIVIPFLLEFNVNVLPALYVLPL